MLDLIVKRFNNPDKTITFNNGKFEIVEIKDIVIGKATYEPKWKWSLSLIHI